MSNDAISRLDEIDLVDDGAVVFRAGRQSFGITTFGVNAMLARGDGDSINERSETEPDSSEEL